MRKLNEEFVVKFALAKGSIDNHEDHPPISIKDKVGELTQTLFNKMHNFSASIYFPQLQLYFKTLKSYKQLGKITHHFPINSISLANFKLEINNKIDFLTTVNLVPSANLITQKTSKELSLANSSLISVVFTNILHFYKLNIHFYQLDIASSILYDFGLFGRPESNQKYYTSLFQILNDFFEKFADQLETLVISISCSMSTWTTSLIIQFSIK